MAQSGKLTFFTEREFSDPPTMIERILERFGHHKTVFVYRTIGEERSWEASHEAIREEDIVASADDGTPIIVWDPEDVEIEDLGRRIDVRDVPALYERGKCLVIGLSMDPLGAVMAEALRAVIPPEIDGGFLPREPIIRIGYHDIFEYAEHDEGHIFGHAFFSFSLFSYSTPRDWPRYRKMVFGVPAVLDLRRQIEEIVGPLEQCVYWDI